MSLYLTAYYVLIEKNPQLISQVTQVIEVAVITQSLRNSIV